MPPTAHLLPPVQRPPSTKVMPPPTLPSSSPPLTSSSPDLPSSSPSGSSFSSATAARSGEIAIFGRSADPFNKDNWEDDFDLDGSTDTLADTTTTRNSKPTQLAHSNTTDDIDDWDEEIAREERTLSHSHNAANNTAADSHAPGHAHRRSLPQLQLPNKQRESPRLSYRQSPHPQQLAGSTEEQEEEEEDWDREIEEETKQHSLRLSHKPTTPKPAVSSKADSAHSHSASTSNNQLKATLHRMLGMAEDGDEEEVSTNGSAGDEASGEAVGPHRQPVAAASAVLRLLVARQHCHLPAALVTLLTENSRRPTRNDRETT